MVHLKLLAQSITGVETNLDTISDDTIVGLAEHHGISQLLEQQVRRGSTRGIGSEARGRLEQKSRDQAALDLLLINDTRATLDLIAAHDIPVLLLKGTPIALLYYESAQQRPRCDTDLYIEETRIEDVESLLAECGYAIHRDRNRTHSSKQFVALKPSFQEISSQFDIHWKLSNRVMFRTTLPFEECYGSRQPVPALGPNAHTLATADLLLHACIHRIAHGRNTERNRLIWLYDIHLLWNMMDDEEKALFIQKALRKKVGALCSDALEVCNYLFDPAGQDQAILASYTQQLRSNASTEPSAKLIHASKTHWAWADLQTIDGLMQKAGFVKELIRGKLT